MNRRAAGHALRLTALVGALASAGLSMAQETTPSFAGTAGFDAASDTDGFHAYRGRLGGLIRYDNPWSYAGVSVQSTRYTQDGFRQDVPGVMAVYRDQRRDTLAGVDVQAGVAEVSGHLRLIGDATLRMTPSPTTAVDLLASADVVETPLALDRGIAFGFLGAGVEQQFGERFTATGFVGYQPFTDGNARTHVRARLIWLAVPEHGITAQLRYRQYDTKDLDVEGAYFNPERYQQWLGVAAIRKRHAGWIYTGALGAGQERSTGTGTRPSYLAEIRAEGVVTRDVRLVLNAGYYRAAGFIDSPDYGYRTIGAAIVVPFR